MIDSVLVPYEPSWFSRYVPASRIRNIADDKLGLADIHFKWHRHCRPDRRDISGLVVDDTRQAGRVRNSGRRGRRLIDWSFDKKYSTAIVVFVVLHV